MNITRDQVVNYLSNMPVIELAGLMKELESAWGVTAAAPVVQTQQAPQTLPVVVDEQTEFEVILTAAGANKIGVIKTIRELTGLGLKEAKDFVDGAPKTVKDGLSKADADEMRAKLAGVGATVEIK